MSAQDVAAMRKTHKEAEVAYHQAKVGALEFMAEEMRRTGEEYTAEELSAMSGLSTGEIASQLNGHGYDGIRAGICRVNRHRKGIEEVYVRILPNGEINHNQMVAIRRIKTLYSLPPHHGEYYHNGEYR